MVNSIGIFNDKYYYNGQEYDNYNINSLLEKLGNKRKLFILSQSIFIKKYKISKKILNIEKIIEKKIAEDFSDKKNLLFHYEFIKNSKELYIYSIRCDNLLNLCMNVNYIEIEPIQFLIRKYVIKNIKGSKSSIIIYKIKDLFHLINIEDGVIEECYVTNEAKEIKSFLDNYENQNKLLIIDESIKDTFIEKYDYIINIGEKLYEKIFKK